MSSTSSGSYGSSSTRKSTMSYTACDFSLVMLQRLLICTSVILGYDLVYSPRDIPCMILIHAMARIIRNFFYLSKGVRKWLAIHYNEGIIPDPPLQYGRSSLRFARSTPNVSNLPSKFGESLKHSPIERRYSEPSNKFDLATALKEQRNRSEGMEPIHRYADFSNASDPFGHSSLMSLHFLFNGLAQSFLGYLDDPDEEMNQKVVEAAASSKNKEKNTETDNSMLTRPRTSQSLQSSTQFDMSENQRRVAEVVESILEHDAQQRKMNSSSQSGGSYDLKPLPIPNFDEYATPVHQQPKKPLTCITEVKGGGRCSLMNEEAEESWRNEVVEQSWNEEVEEK